MDPSPNGRLISFNSSRASRWQHPPDTALSLTMELWALTEDGGQVQLTRYGEELPALTRSVTSDYAWGPDGRSLASLHVEVQLGQYTQIIEVLTLDQAW